MHWQQQQQSLHQPSTLLSDTAARSIMSLCGCVPQYVLPEFEVCNHEVSDVLEEVLADIALIRNPDVVDAGTPGRTSTAPHVDMAALLRHTETVGPHLQRVTATLNLHCTTKTPRRVLGVTLPFGKAQQQRLVEQWHVPLLIVSRLYDEADMSAQQRTVTAVEEVRHAEDMERALLIVKQSIITQACSNVPDWCLPPSTTHSILSCGLTYARTPEEAVAAAGEATRADDGTGRVGFNTVSQLLAMTNTSML